MRTIVNMSSMHSYSYSYGYHSYHENSPNYDAIKQSDTRSEVSV